MIWIAAELIPAVPVEDVLALIQDYDNHTNVYKPEVVASKLLKRQGNVFQIYLRLRKQKTLPLFWIRTTTPSIAVSTGHGGCSVLTQPGWLKLRMWEARKKK